MSYDAATLTALASGALVIRDFLFIRGRDGAGDPVTFGWWSGEDNVSVDVVSAIDGATESRDYVGGGSLLDIPPIVDAVGFAAQALEFGLNPLHPDVRDMVLGYDIRLAVTELHRGLFDAATWTIVSTPFPRFLGRVDGAPIETAAVGGTSRLPLSVMPDTIDLTRTSPALKSDEQQKLRSGDRFRRYADTAGDVEVWWGQAKGAA